MNVYDGRNDPAYLARLLKKAAEDEGCAAGKCPSAATRDHRPVPPATRPGAASATTTNSDADSKYRYAPCRRVRWQ